MTQDALVSIVIPCYNSERFIGEAIRSALAQTYPHREVIVVDDGSTDGSLDVIRSFGDAIRWETGPNRGAPSARNRGVALARGTFIQFFDADDLLLPQKLERQVAAALAEPEVVYYCDVEVVMMDGSQPPFVHTQSDRESDPVVFALNKILLTNPPLHRKAQLEAVGGFREGLPCAQDYDLHLRMACRGIRFRRLPEVLVRMRRVAGSVSSNSVRVLDIWGDIYWRCYRELEARGELTDRRARAFAGRMAGAARAYLRYGLPEQARQRFDDARRMHPGGGLDVAYSRGTRALRRLIGPVLTERLVMARRAAEPSFRF